MKSSRTRSKSQASGKTAVHLSFSDVHQHLDDNFDEMMPCPQSAPEQRTTLPPQPKAKVLFQFFDGRSMSES